MFCSHCKDILSFHWALTKFLFMFQNSDNSFLPQEAFRDLLSRSEPIIPWMNLYFGAFIVTVILIYLALCQ